MGEPGVVRVRMVLAAAGPDFSAPAGAVVPLPAGLAAELVALGAAESLELERVPEAAVAPAAGETAALEVGPASEKLRPAGGRRKSERRG